jgi:hypothetical protein
MSPTEKRPKIVPTWSRNGELEPRSIAQPQDVPLCIMGGGPKEGPECLNIYNSSDIGREALV